MGLLRQGGDFPNRTVVEYATVDVIIPNGRLPKTLIEHRSPLESMARLSVTTSKGRLTCGEIVLESVELAERLVEYLHKQFKTRPYSDCYQLEVKVLTSTRTKTTTRLKMKHSSEVKALLSEQH